MEIYGFRTDRGQRSRLGKATLILSTYLIYKVLEILEY